MIFLPAVDWLIVSGMVGAIILIIIVALLVSPPTALVRKFHTKDEEE